MDYAKTPIYLRHVCKVHLARREFKENELGKQNQKRKKFTAVTQLLPLVQGIKVPKHFNNALLSDRSAFSTSSSTSLCSITDPFTWLRHWAWQQPCPWIINTSQINNQANSWRKSLFPITSCEKNGWKWYNVYYMDSINWKGGGEKQRLNRRYMKEKTKLH